MSYTQMVNVKQYKGQPQRDWNNKQWLQHAHIQVHNPWLTDEDRLYWRDKIKELNADLSSE